MNSRAHNHYFKPVPLGVTHIDVYRVLEMFGVTNPSLQHAIKKLLVAGGRGAGKDITQDVREAADSVIRWIEMRDEERVPSAATRAGKSEVISREEAHREELAALGGAALEVLRKRDTSHDIIAGHGEAEAVGKAMEEHRAQQEIDHLKSVIQALRRPLDGVDSIVNVPQFLKAVANRYEAAVGSSGVHSYQIPLLRSLAEAIREALKYADTTAEYAKQGVFSGPCASGKTDLTAVTAAGLTEDEATLVRTLRAKEVNFKSACVRVSAVSDDVVVYFARKDA